MSCIIAYPNPALWLVILVSLDSCGPTVMARSLTDGHCGQGEEALYKYNWSLCLASIYFCQIYLKKYVFFICA